MSATERNSGTCLPAAAYLRLWVRAEKQIQNPPRFRSTVYPAPKKKEVKK